MDSNMRFRLNTMVAVCNRERIPAAEQSEKCQVTGRRVANPAT